MSLYILVLWYFLGLFHDFSMFEVCAGNEKALFKAKVTSWYLQPRYSIDQMGSYLINVK